MFKFPVKPTALLLLLLYGVMIGGMAGCAPEEASPLFPGGRKVYAEPAEQVDPRLVKANTGFALNLFQVLQKAEPGENIFISPASVSLALAMTYNGAAGETAKAMAKVLGFTDMDPDAINTAFADLRTILQNPDPKVELSLANSLWARQGQDFYEEFLQQNRDFFDARVESLDFGSRDAAKTINRWVEEQTNGKIKDLIQPPINPLTVLFLINAIYLKAQWAEPFDPDLTREIPFNHPGGSSKDHPVMFRDGSFQYLEEEGFQAVVLPYGKNRRVALYLFLPAPDQTLADFYHKMEGWDFLPDSFEESKGTVGLPRFKFEYESSLNDALKSLGMGLAFDPNQADFSNLRPTPPELFIAEVKHKAFVEVNEEGTEAAAATSVEINCLGIAPDPERFSMIVDRPFFFSIVDQKTGSILFMGAVTDPEC
ncbi:MAG: serpin family protein [Firmicutes bacterium]|nr:serpin family protein [Bacillota bacterium]